MVTRTVRGATSADVDDERSRRRARGLRRAEDLTPGSRVQTAEQCSRIRIFRFFFRFQKNMTLRFFEMILKKT